MNVPPLGVSGLACLSPPHQAPIFLGAILFLPLDPNLVSLPPLLPLNANFEHGPESSPRGGVRPGLQGYTYFGELERHNAGPLWGATWVAGSSSSSSFHPPPPHLQLIGTLSGNAQTVGVKPLLPPQWRTRPPRGRGTSENVPYYFSKTNNNSAAERQAADTGVCGIRRGAEARKTLPVSRKREACNAHRGGARARQGLIANFVAKGPAGLHARSHYPPPTPVQNRRPPNGWKGEILRHSKGRCGIKREAFCTEHIAPPRRAFQPESCARLTRVRSCALLAGYLLWLDVGCLKAKRPSAPLNTHTQIQTPSPRLLVLPFSGGEVEAFRPTVRLHLG